MRVSWAYASGFLDGENGKKYPVFVSRFVTGLDQQEVSHIGVLGPDDKGFYTAAIPGKPGTLVITPGEMKDRFEVGLVKGATTRLASWGRLEGDIFVAGERIRVSGPAWVEEEAGEINYADSWRWISIRLDDGRRILHQDTGRPDTTVVARWPAGGGLAVMLDPQAAVVEATREWTSPTGSKYGTEWKLWIGDEEYTVRACSEDQRFEDRALLGVAYWEGFCLVYDKAGSIVGHAFVEQLLPGWDVPNAEEQHIKAAMLGNQDAIDFCYLVARMSQVADDYADGDARGAAKMVDLIAWLAIDLPKNPFYAEHRASLEPVLEMGLLYWDAADEWKKSPRKESRMFGFVFREILEMAFARAALIVGGREHARKVIREMHAYYHVKNGDAFDAWEGAEYGIKP